MPILKAISGHTDVQGIKRYLEKDGRAIAQDFYNLSWDDREMVDHGDGWKQSTQWADQMDRTRHRNGNDQPWKGRRARTFKHFVLSPDPEDRIDLPALRELASAWALEHFEDHQIAIIYHDDNEHRIPHAHIVVNNTNLATGKRMHTDRPEDLNRELQDMARERGLRGLSNEMEPKTGLERLATRNAREGAPPRTKQSVYMGRKERGIVETGGYSWVTDIRGRVTIAKTLAHSEKEFMGLLEKMEVIVSDNSEKARRQDWIFSLADQPTKKVSGERLGMSFGKEALQRRFERQGSYHPTATSEAVIRARAEQAVELNDLCDLDKLASTLKTCSRFNVRSLEDFDKRLSNKAAAPEKVREELRQARDYMTENKLLPQRISKSQAPARRPADSRPHAQADAAKRQRQAQVQQQEQQRQRRRER